MIRMIQSSSEGQAKEYFSEALVKSDYYIKENDQELPGTFHGKLAARLELPDKTSKEAFFALCENRHPVTGEALTPHTKKNRTTGYDINFHCPKSVSVLHILSDDNHILNAFQKSVRATMQDIERAAATRVRKDGKYEDRVTGELCWGEFIHQTARPVEGHVPDMHLHAHNFLFNCTWDKTENLIKAAKFRQIQQDMPYFQRQFHKRLSDELVNLGYRIRLTDHAFEIEGIPDEVIRHFSKRTNAIGQIAKEKGITDAKELDALGARTRSRKQKGLTMTELKVEWKRQMRELDTGRIQDSPVRFTPVRETKSVKAKECLDYAISHCFERASVVPDKKIIQTAYRFAMGHASVSVDDITAAFDGDTRFIRFDHGTRKLCTTKTALREEQRMVELARNGLGKMLPMYLTLPDFKDAKDQQADAVAHVLTTRDQVVIIRGGAGTGKTTLMKEAALWIGEAGKKVIAVAPTANAARVVLKEDGFKDAETVAKLLTDETLQKSLTGQVLLVDEAGLLGTREMLSLLELAAKHKARVVLVGDTRQHSSVARGDALRILNTVGAITAAEVSKIHRQKTYPYRSAVEDLSKGNTKEAFEKLDAMGAIKTIDPLDPHTVLVDDYMRTVKAKKSALIVSPTHDQGDAVTRHIRERLRQEGRIGKREIDVEKLVNCNLTEAEKSDMRNFYKGQIVQFNQNLKKIKRGSVWVIEGHKGDDLLINDGKGETLALPCKKGKYFDVFDLVTMNLAKGDKVRITRNGFDEKKRRLTNGMSLIVKAVTKKGEVYLYNPLSKSSYLVKKNFGHITHDYCVTSHASQGKTVDDVFIMQPAATFPATNLKQFYVSVSRGRHEARIYTDDRNALLEHASEMGDRLSALELVARNRKKTTDAIHLKRERNYTNFILPIIENKPKPFERKAIDIDHEPRL